jgi:uncharacterized protein
VKNTLEPPARLLDWRLGGVLLGLLMTAAIGLLRPIGVTTSYCTTWGMALDGIAPRWTAAQPYFKVVGTALSGEVMLVLGLIVGGLVASALSRTRTRSAVPPLWGARFGPSPALRFAVAFAGGFLLLFGARLAGGCTSGHVLSGISQLAFSGMVFAAGVFASGIVVARSLYRGIS